MIKKNVCLYLTGDDDDDARLALYEKQNLMFIRPIGECVAVACSLRRKCKTT